MSLSTRQKSILDWTTNDSEYAVIEAGYNKLRIKDYDKPQMGSLIDCIARWRYYVGAGGSVSAEDLLILSSFLKANYGGLTVDDIDLAVKLSITDKLGIDAKCYTFSPQYCATVLNAYNDYKTELVREVLQRRDAEEMKIAENQKPSPAQERETMIQILLTEYKTFTDTGMVDDSFSIIYNHLKKTGRLKFKKYEVDEAKAYGKRMAGESAHKFTQNLRDYMEALDGTKKSTQKEYLENKFARNFCVQKYFNTIKIDELVESLKLSEFE